MGEDVGSRDTSGRTPHSQETFTVYNVSNEYVSGCHMGVMLYLPEVPLLPTERNKSGESRRRGYRESERKKL